MIGRGDEVLKERDKINALLKKNVLENTSPWGVTVELLEMKDVEIPQDMQRVMAMEAEAMLCTSPEVYRNFSRERAGA